MDKDIKEKENSKMSYKEKVKRVIFNKFYIEFFAYFIIMFFGLILCSITYSLKNENIVLIGGIAISIVICIVMYIFGYIIANKRKGLNKYFPVVSILTIFLVVYIIDNLFKCSTSDFFLLKMIYRIDYMILSLHHIIFEWINEAFYINIPKELFVFICPLMLFLSARRNKINQFKKEKIEKSKEGGKNNGESNK